MNRLVLVIHDVRSAHNVGSLLRTADGLGVDEVYITGISPYPEAKDDQRIPHHRQRVASQIHKTALGAEYSLKWRYISKINDCLTLLKKDGYQIIALEQTDDAIGLDDFDPQSDVALIVGNEVAGIEKLVLDQVDHKLQIKMRGQKESFNVAIAAAITLYKLSHDLKPRQK